MRAVRGRVVDELGRAVAGARIHAVASFRFSISAGGFAPAQIVSSEPLAVSDTDGRFLGSADPLSTGLIVAATEQWSASASTEFAGPEHDVTLVVTRVPNLTGTILAADGNPAPRVDVRVRASKLHQEVRGRSLDDGTFALRIAPGADVVDLLVGALEGEPPSPLGIGVALQSVTIPHAGLVVRLEEPARLEGVVVGLESEPAPAVVDVLRVDAGAVPFRTRVGAPEGTFALAQLRPGRYSVRARSLTPTAGAVTEAAEIVLPCGPVRLVLRAPETLHGRLLGEDVAGFRVLLVEDDARFGREQRDARTDTEGRFEFHGLQGPVRVIARRMGDDRYADLVATPGPLDVDVTLLSGQRIEGRLLKGPPYDGARVLARQDGIEVDVRLDSDGGFSLRGLAPGEWSLFVTNRSQGEGFAMEWGEDLRLQAEAGATEVLVP
jgi:hypothetical protein